MPLVDLTTNLKSLKYGRDTTNGGSSGEPFITKDINGLTIEDLGRTGGSDLLIRGGFLLGDRIKDDVLRIGKYLSTPEGLLWSATQNVLSTSGVRIYGGYDLTTRLANFNRLNDGTYLPTSTLAQLAVNPFGGHLNKQGIDPSGLTPGQNRPEYIELQKALATANSGKSGEQERNRLLRLTKRHRTSPTFSSTRREFTNIYSYLGGPGGGSLVGGPGRTSIRFADQRTGNWSAKKRYFETTQYGWVDLTTLSDYNQLLKNGVSFSYGLNNEKTNLISTGNGLPDGWSAAPFSLTNNPDKFKDTPLNPGKLVDRGAVLKEFDPEHKGIVDKYIEGYEKDYKVQSSPEFDTSTPPFDFPIPNPDRRFEGLNQKNLTQIQDFRATKKNRVKAPSYSDKNIEKRVLLGDPGSSFIDTRDYTKSSTVGQDKINNLYLYKASSVADSRFTNDLVKFRIATIDPDEPNKAVFTHFRAYINGMSDSFGAEWNSFRYMGRGEDFYNYQGFNRSMRLNWTVMAQSKYELSTQYQKLNYLASTLAPNYSDAGFMRGNIHRLTIGGYVYEYPGIIESLDFTIPDDSPWEIGINTAGGFDSDVKELPHRIEVAMSFRPISTFLPQTVGSGLSQKENPEGINGSGKIKQRFLSLEDDGNSNNLYHGKNGNGTVNSVKVS